MLESDNDNNSCFLFRRTGTSLTLLTRGDWRNAKELIDILVEANQVGMGESFQDYS